MLVEDSKGISIEIMGKQHKIACSAEQAEDLKQAAQNLATMCDEIKQQKGTASSERALLVASINLSYSLLLANKTIKGFQRGHNALLTQLKSAL
ncbi:cell division protein ZapA [Colwellia chukchiensis]|uniref:Cell division protein ZapA n=1 Tax=Colwellia chukchiensis TaxID=641665 RepID=A0A1H7MQY1_9GAMM|nr:cell division protein ZapA [Colwellia chukchiensis]SEL13095.1 cell division protein ZapA [Colwellia chukchiensis]